MVVDVPSPYNAILFRWWIHKIQAIPSTYHQVVRFPTQYGMMELNQEYCPKVPLGLMRPSQHAKDVSRCRVAAVTPKLDRLPEEGTVWGMSLPRTRRTVSNYSSHHRQQGVSRVMGQRE